MVNGVSDVPACECKACLEGRKGKNDAAIARVRGAFMHSVLEGADEKEAFFSSLKAIDEKYNPRQDAFLKKGQFNCKAVNSESVKKWLEIINLAVPIFVSALKVVNDIIDTFFKKTNPAEDAPKDENVPAEKLD